MKEDVKTPSVKIGEHTMSPEFPYGLQNTTQHVASDDPRFASVPMPANNAVHFSGVMHIDENNWQEVIRQILLVRSLLLHAISACCLCRGCFLLLAYGSSYQSAAVLYFLGAVIVEAILAIKIETSVRLYFKRRDIMARSVPKEYRPANDATVLFTDAGIIIKTLSLPPERIYYYDSVKKVLKSRHLIIVYFDGGFSMFISKDTLKGGTVDELLQFINGRRRASCTQAKGI